MSYGDPFVGLNLKLSAGRFNTSEGESLRSCELEIGRKEGTSSNLSDAEIRKALASIAAWFNVEAPNGDQ